MNSKVLLPMLLCCAGCLTNHYEDYYIETSEGKKTVLGRESAPVELRLATTEEDVINVIEDGYVSVGYSSFTAPYTAMSLAVDTAEDHGADLVLLDIRFKEKQKYTSVIYLPTTSTSYTYGSVNVSGYGAGGYSSGHGTYSGTTTTTTLNAIPVQRERGIYTHDAMFFKKIDTSNNYGVHFFVPKRLPTEAVDAPIKVRVLAVIHGTQAERDGIKRGQIVKSVNGRPIKTRADIAQYQDNPATIKSMEVENAN